MNTICYLVERLGPYHIARLNRTAEILSLEVHALELDPRSDTYAWEDGDSANSSKFIRHSLPKKGDVRSFNRVLDKVNPSAVFLNGWADWGALQGLVWCLQHETPAIVMSDSQARDERRVAWKEALKGRFVRHCQAAFVAGQRHVGYAVSLGMTERQIVTGYDVVDNDHFRLGAAAVRAESAPQKRRLGLPPERPYFLCVSRFVPKKNLSLLLRAYHAYRQRRRGSLRDAGPPWDLVLLGDGEGRKALEARIAADQLGEHVHLLGFRQYDELPAYYGLAGALVLASTSDQWGLAVNEGMSAGIPVLVSEACGCVPELVCEGVNGYTFEPADESALTGVLLKTASASADVLGAMGDASQRIIADWSLSRFAEGIHQSVQLAVAGKQTGGRMNKLVSRALFRCLARLR